MIYKKQIKSKYDNNDTCQIKNGFGEHQYQKYILSNTNDTYKNEFEGITCNMMTQDLF